MNLKQLYPFFENTFSLLTLKAIELGLTIGLIPYLILKVGFHNYGIYVFAMSLMLFFVNILSYGFDLSTVREIAKHKNDSVKVSQLFSEVLSVKLVLFLGVSLVLLLLAFFVPTFWKNKTLYFFSYLLLINELLSLRWFFLGIEKTKITAIISLIGTLMYVLLVLYFVRKPIDYLLIPLLEFLGIFPIAFIALIWVLKSFKIRIQLISLKEIIQYLRFNFSSFVNLLLPSTYAITLVFMVGVLGVPQQVSMIQLGVKISNAFSTLNTILTSVFFPIVNRKKTILIISRVALLTVGFVLTGVMYFSAPFLVSNWISFSSQLILENTIVIVKILSPVPFLMAIISSFGLNGLLVNYQDKLYSKIILTASVSMLLFSGLFIPAFYVVGGAIAFLLGRFVHALLSYFSFKKLVQWD